MQKQSKGLERNTIDKYYTSKHVVELCMQLFRQHLTILPSDLIIEPSAGNGAFIDGIHTINVSKLFYDLEPEHEQIQCQDYLALPTDDLQKQFSAIHVIGNPPFGRQSSTAKQFIKKSCTFCDTVAFILPKSFKKPSMQMCFPLEFRLECEIDLPDNAFIVGGKPHDVPCVFQIWRKHVTPRNIQEKMEPCASYSFVKKQELPDISFRRVGVNAGKIDTDIDNKSEQSHYFIRFHNGINVMENVNTLNKKLTFHFNNTVGPKSISKQELIQQFNLYL